jgi:hypothetical protein
MTLKKRLEKPRGLNSSNIIQKLSNNLTSKHSKKRKRKKQ